MLFNTLTCKLYLKFLISGVRIKREVSKTAPNFGDKIFEKIDADDVLLDRVTYIQNGNKIVTFLVGQYPDVFVTCVRGLNFGDVKGEVQNIWVNSKFDQPVYAKVKTDHDEEVRIFFEVYGRKK